MLSLLPEHVDAAVAALPNPTILALRMYGRDVFVAGGFLRAVVARETISDVDLFIGAGAAFNTTELIQHININDAFDTHSTPNAMSIETDPCTQVVLRSTYATPTKCIASFDFTICQAALWWHEGLGKWETECTPSFYPDLAARRLRYTSYKGPDASDPMNTAIRVLKFYERGYVIDETSYRSIILNAGTLELPEDLTKKENKILTRSTATY